MLCLLGRPLLILEMLVQDLMSTTCISLPFHMGDLHHERGHALRLPMLFFRKRLADIYLPLSAPLLT